MIQMFFHALGLCPCSHGHADLADLAPALAGLGVAATYAGARMRAILRRLSGRGGCRS